MTMIKVVRTSSSRCCLFIQKLASSTSRSTRTQHYRQFSAMTAPPPVCLLEDMVVPSRQLFGPGPSNMAESIGNSQSRSLLGHLHPEFVKIMSDTREGLQYLFKTTNAYTLAASGTGHAGMECALLNLLERGEKLLVVQIGLWGQRAADLGRRLGAEVVVVEAPLGQAMETSKIIQALREHKPAVMFVCHGESSTGVCQPLEGLGDVCKETNTLLLVDTVASIGGAPFAMDALGVDCVYTATQKVLNAPPGLAPISFSDRAIQKVKGRKERVASFYFDCLELGNYWGCDGQPKRYHHTAPISTVYALREALALVAKEGIDNVIARHKKNVNYLYKKLAENNIQPFVENENWRLPCLTTIKVPENVAWKEVMDELMANGVEVAGGLGSTVGKIWRMGTFGVNSDEKKIDHVVNLLATAVNKRRSNFNRDVISPNMPIKLEDKKVGKKAKSTPRRKRRATSDSEDDFDDDHNPRIDFYSASLGTMNKKVTAQASKCLQELHDRIASPPAESPVDGSFERMFLFGSSSSEAEVKKEELDC